MSYVITRRPLTDPETYEHEQVYTLTDQTIMGNRVLGKGVFKGWHEMSLAETPVFFNSEDRAASRIFTLKNQSPDWNYAVRYYE